MTERRTIGDILTSLGRITEDDVATALAFQRDRGGYFGEALVACGLVTEDELEWGLASQFDLPYVFPDADSVDPEAASLVSPEWALANLVLPILRAGDTLNVVVDSPLKDGPVEELQARTGLQVERALASPSAIRELIRQVYARASAADEEQHRSVELHEALDMVLLVEAPRFGISVRGVRAHVWWDDHGVIRRRPLAGDWRAALERILVPGPSEMTSTSMRVMWEAELSRSGVVTPMEVRYLADESGREYLFQPRGPASTLVERFPPAHAGVVTEVQMLARSGTARFVVMTDPPSLGHEILPHLPSLLLDPAWRSIYVNAGDQPVAEEAFSLRMPTDPETWTSEIEALRAFHFDVVTVDLSGGDFAWASSALDIASVAFLLWSGGDDMGPAREAGIRWILRIEQDAEGDPAWSLEPLDG